MSHRTLEVLQGVFIGDTRIGNDLAIRVVDALQSANLHIVEGSPECLRRALATLVEESVNPGDGGPYEDGEWPALDMARRALGIPTFAETQSVRHALQLGLDAVNESFGYAQTRDDHLLAEARHGTIQAALEKTAEPTSEQFGEPRG